MLFFCQPAAHVAYGIPYREPADEDDGEEDDDDVLRVDADRVGIDDEIAGLVAELDKSVGLLQPAEQQSECNADECSSGGDHTSFEEEDTAYLTVCRTEIAQRDDIILLVDDEHGERTDDVEARHHEYECQEQVGKEFLYAHDVEGVGLLLVAVQHPVFPAENILYFLFLPVDVNTRSHAQFQ